MKTKLFLLLFLLAGLCSCESYYFDDNFPKDAFFSYIPYQEGNQLQFIHHLDTMHLTVKMVSQNYSRGQRNCDCIPEAASVTCNLVNDTTSIWYTVSCFNRSDFEIRIEDRWDYENNKGQIKEVGYYHHKQKRSPDEIFNCFTPEILLMAHSGRVKQHVGLLFFSDKNGFKWYEPALDAQLSGKK